MHDKLIKAPSKEELEGSASPFERAQIWLALKTYDALTNLEQRPLTVALQRKYQVAERGAWNGVMVGLAVLAVGGGFLYALQQAVDNKNTLTRAEVSVDLNGQGSLVAYDYGLVVNGLDGLKIQAYPSKMNAIIKQLGLTPSNNQIVVEYITPLGIFDLAISADVISQYVKAKGSSLVSYNAFSFSDARKASLERGVLSKQKLSFELAIRWYQNFKKAVLEKDEELSEYEKQLVAHEMPFWVVSVPAG